MARTQDACAQYLARLASALHEAAPSMNESLPFPDRMRITDVRLGEVQPTDRRGCSAMLTLSAGEAPKSYRVTLTGERERPRLVVSDEADFEDRLELGAPLEEPPGAGDARALYEVLITDVAGHFGTDS